MNDLRDILYSHEYGWCPLYELEPAIRALGFSIESNDDDNSTDGLWSKHVKNTETGKSIDFKGNCWVANSFEALLCWIENGACPQ